RSRLLATNITADQCRPDHAAVARGARQERCARPDRANRAPGEPAAQPRRYRVVPASHGRGSRIQEAARPRRVLSNVRAVPGDGELTRGDLEWFLLLTRRGRA